ncbi:hypothetical protein AWENTII_011927 [Aspergillus wentii]
MRYQSSSKRQWCTHSFAIAVEKDNGAAEHGRIDMLQLLLNAGALSEGEDWWQLVRVVKVTEMYANNATAWCVKAICGWTESDPCCYKIYQDEYAVGLGPG